MRLVLEDYTIIEKWMEFSRHMKEHKCGICMDYWHPGGRDIFKALFDSEYSYFSDAVDIIPKIVEHYKSDGIINVDFVYEGRIVTRRYGFSGIEANMYFLWAPSIERKVRTSCWNSIEAENFTFKYHNISSKKFEKDRILLDEYYEKMKKKLETTIERKINIYICYSYKEVGDLSGKKAMGGASIDPVLLDIITQDSYFIEFTTHEIIHVITRFWGGWPPPVLREGITVAMTEIPYIPLFNEQKYITDIESMFNPEIFRKLMDIDQWPYSYAYAGALVTYLVENYGLKIFKDFYTRCLKDNFKDIFEGLYGFEFVSLQKQWIEWLENDFFKRFSIENMVQRKRFINNCQRRKEYFLKCNGIE